LRWTLRCQTIFAILLILNWLSLLCLFFFSRLVILSFLDLILIFDGLLLFSFTLLLSIWTSIFDFITILLVQVGCFIYLGLFFLFNRFWHEVLLGVIIFIFFIDIVILVFKDLFWLNWFAGLFDFSILVFFVHVWNDFCLFFLHFDVFLLLFDNFWDLFIDFFVLYWSFTFLFFWSFLNYFNRFNNLSRSLLDWTLSLSL